MKPIAEWKNKNKQILAYDSEKREFAVGNMPEKCAFGKWYKQKGVWYGSSIGNFKPTHFIELPTTRELK